MEASAAPATQARTDAQPSGRRVAAVAMASTSDGRTLDGAHLRTMAGAPMPANTLANRAAGAGSGLYQSCVSLRERLWCVPGFGAMFLEPRGGTQPTYDPVSQLWQCFRLGTPLCVLFNHLAPRYAPELPLSVEANLSNANACKALVMRFLIALKERLAWDPDDTFTVTQLYVNDTNGFVKVVRTVNKLLDLLEERGLLLEQPPPSPALATAPEVPDPASDERILVVRELLETERKYVQDLEVLQHYAQMLRQMDVLPSDTLHMLFGNLHQLVDVQRRFLICVEENARRLPRDQHFGHVFRSMEDDFSVYEPFCANYSQALEIINRESQVLARVRSMPNAESFYLEPSYELPAFLIKPVQRICRYPLLLEQLLKKTPQNAPCRPELSEALTVIRRITDKVNETSRHQANAQVVADLAARVENWKGHTLRSFGDLLLSDTFLVSKGDSEREFHVYLFERILLCCKEVGGGGPATPARSRSKSNSLLKQRQGSFSSSSGSSATSRKDAPRPPLQLKGRIFLNNILSIHPLTRTGGTPELPIGSYSLQVWWHGEMELESFSLKCRNEEQLRLWHTTLQRQLDDLALRRQQHATRAQNLPKLNLTAASAAAAAAAPRTPRGGFLQVTTPIVTMPGEAPPPAACARAGSLSSQYSTEEELRQARPLDRAGSLGEEESLLSAANSPSAGAFSLPGSAGHSPSVPTFPSMPVRPRLRPSGSATPGSTPVSPGAPPPLTRTSSAATMTTSTAPVPVTAMARSATLTAPVSGSLDGLEDDAAAMHLSTAPVSLAGAGSAGTAPSAARSAASRKNSAPMMQRTGSDTHPARSIPIPDGAATAHSGSGAGTPAVGTPGVGVSMSSSSGSPTSMSPTLGGWNPYFPAISSPPNGLTNREDSEGSSSGNVSSAGSFTANASPLPTPRSTMRITLVHGGESFHFLVPDTIRYQALYDLACEKRVAHLRENAARLRPPALYYVDADGDRVMMHDDDDMAMAMDQGRVAGHGQLDVILE